jgi:citrate synthase
VFYNEVKYVLDNDKISYESYDGNTGSYKWQNIKSIEEDENFFRIILPTEASFLFVKNKLPNETQLAIRELLRKVKLKTNVLEHLGN